LVLSESEREELSALVLRRKTAQALALRARIVLACAEGQDSKVVAARQRVTPQTWASGARGLCCIASMDCWTRRAVEHPERSTTRVWMR
jgi:hypothetical protein